MSDEWRKIMQDPVAEEFYRLFTSLNPVRSTRSQTLSIEVADIAAHYAQAVGAGVEIVIDLIDDGQGMQSYICRDIDGNIWHIGNR
jgi:uncharacterized glyoxalase superfamily protein PhnB